MSQQLSGTIIRSIYVEWLNSCHRRTANISDRTTFRTDRPVSGSRSRTMAFVAPTGQRISRTAASVWAEAESPGRRESTSAHTERNNHPTAHCVPLPRRPDMMPDNRGRAIPPRRTIDPAARVPRISSDTSGNAPTSVRTRITEAPIVRPARTDGAYAWAALPPHRPGSPTDDARRRAHRNRPRCARVRGGGRC